MSSKTKIVVLRMKEIIYTAIFIGLGILLITLFFIMFRPKGSAEPASAQVQLYVPGVYASTITLNNQNVNVEVSVDGSRISSISLVPLNESITTMYPLMESAMESLAAQIVEKQSLENLSYAEESRYTSSVLLGAIQSALKKAELSER